AIGRDAASVGNWDLVEAYSANGINWIKKQGMNGTIWTLIALDCGGYETSDPTIRQQCVDAIVSAQHNDGGWSLVTAKTQPSNVDITGMTLTALYPYRNQPEVKAACEEAFEWLSESQLDNGGFPYGKGETSESCVWAIVACTTWGINPDTDPRFIKNGNSAIDNLLTYYLEDQAMFEHGRGAGANAMATDQATYGLVAYDRLVKGKTALYDYSDVTAGPSAPSGDEMVATLGLPGEINPGAAFNATISIDKWDNEAGYKLIDLIVNIPEGVSVTGVTASNRLEGGAISWNVEEETGKLRIVYFDANENKSLTITGEEFPAELFTVALKADSVAGGSKVNVEISGMSVKLTSDSADDASMEEVNTDIAKDTVDVVVGISFSAKCLYTGDDVDIIPSTKKAVAVAITGIAKGAKLTFKDGETEIIFQYSKEITEKTGVSTYVALVDAEIDMAKFIDEKNFNIAAVSEENAITFGDTNGDGVVNAEDALAAVNTWLRVGEEPTDIQILTMNVNGDSRINTYDALGIVEAFVNKTDYIVVTKAATITENQ
ncbi:MAG: dockerin type I domain-containing protein, partial [Oscillospiraceae bacterium]|nr:dockerin type I domain-containing protein [Oscillospiraceae bacterium]